MQDKLKLLLEKLQLNKDDYDYFKDGKILKLKLDASRKNGVFVLLIKNIIPDNVISFMNNNLKTAFPDMNTMKIEFIIENLDYKKLSDYYFNAIDNSSLTRPMKELFKEKKISINENEIIIELDNIAEENIFNNHKDSIINYYKKLGFTDVDIKIIINKENSIDIKKELENEIKNETKEIVKEKESPIIYGEEPKGDITLIKDIITEEGNITVEAYVFGVEEFESSKSAFKILTFKISDNTDSIYAKFFTKDKDDFKNLSKKMKSGWFRINGYVKQDVYAKDLVLNIRNVIKIPSKDVIVEDDAEEKRVELHAHTMMSQMDGITKVDLGKHTCELVTNAINMGYRGVAITDHNGCQAFPIAYGLIKAHNKSIEDPKKHFKGLYGTELTLVDDTINIVVRPSNLPLEDTCYVVFDTETTGFNAGGEDQMIEIGAVKIKNGEIIDSFDKLIDPKRHIPDRITELTCITDEMVSGQDDEETVTKAFLNWTGNLPMVAHNAKFDISFITMAMKKYNLGEFTNTVIDTLELSRTLDQGYARHSLSALVKRYNIPWEEDAHHRADYDAKGTGLVFHKMIQKLISQNFEKISDLNKLVPKDEIHKFGRTYHFNAIAINKKGLKNLFKIISLANTVYLYKTPRILRSKLEELREGLLIGSGCYESEVFTLARSKEGEELTNIINFYDYVEVQPPEVYNHLLQLGDFSDEEELLNHIRKIINMTKSAGKIIVATGDVHHFKREDKVYREIIVNQKVPGGGRHPLAKNDIKEIPSQHFRTTKEMLNDFAFLGDELAYEIVVTNTNKILDMTDELEVIVDTGGVPFSPRIKSDDGKSYLDCPRVVTDLVYDRAASWYGNPLPHNIEERIAIELYGNIVYTACNYKIKENNPNIDEESLVNETIDMLHTTIVNGFDSVKELLKEYLTKTWDSEDELNDDTLNKRIKKELGGVIGAGFDPIYLIAQRLVKHSNDDG